MPCVPVSRCGRDRPDFLRHFELCDLSSTDVTLEPMQSEGVTVTVQDEPLPQAALYWISGGASAVALKKRKSGTHLLARLLGVEPAALPALILAAHQQYAPPTSSSGSPARDAHAFTPITTPVPTGPRLALSLDHGSSIHLFPGRDCALTRLDQTVHLCTVAGTAGPLFFKIDGLCDADYALLQQRLSGVGGVGAGADASASASVIPSFTLTATTTATASPVRLALSSGEDSATETPEPASPIQSRQCLYCHCTRTPLWRRGPDGVASLCNACGVKWKSGRITIEPSAIIADAEPVKLME